MDPKAININRKQSMGRRKIEIKKIEEKASRQVTFTKRRTGLFRKASELCLLTGAEVAIFVVSPKEKIFTFGHPSVEAIIGRYLQVGNNLEGSENYYTQTLREPSCEISEILKKLRMLEAERDRLKAMNKHNLLQGVNGSGNWWDRNVEGMELEELAKFRESLEELKKKVELKAVEKCMDEAGQKGKLVPSHYSGMEVDLSQNLTRPYFENSLSFPL